MKEGWWDGFRVWEENRGIGGFWFRVLGLLWVRVMCWKRERDDEVERERGASEMQMEWAWRMQGWWRGFEGLGMVREEAGDFSWFGALGRRRNAERESALRGRG